MSHDLRVNDPSTLRTERVRTHAQLEAAWRIRLEVFVVEQKVPLDEEVDEADTAPTTTHVIVVPEDAPLRAVGTGRLLRDPAHPGVVHIGRVAVQAAWRAEGVGAMVMRALEGLALAEVSVEGAVRVELSAQEGAIGFYERLGYTITGERYLDAGIWHRDAHTTLTTTAAAAREA